MGNIKIKNICDYYLRLFLLLKVQDRSNNNNNTADRCTIPLVSNIILICLTISILLYNDKLNKTYQVLFEKFF